MTLNSLITRKVTPLIEDQLRGGLESPVVKENENATCEQCKKLFMRKIGSSRSKCYNCSPLGKYEGEDVTQGD